MIVSRVMRIILIVAELSIRRPQKFTPQNIILKVAGGNFHSIKFVSATDVSKILIIKGKVLDIAIEVFENTLPNLLKSILNQEKIILITLSLLVDWIC